MVESRLAGCPDYDRCIPEWLADWRKIPGIHSDDLLDFLCIYHNSGMELLFRTVPYLIGSRKSTTVLYRWLYILAVFIGPYLTVEAVWNMADIFNGLMALPNIIALLALSGVIARDTKAYFKKSALQK